jgi:hypothetical protein
MDPGTDAREVLDGISVKLKHGWIGVVNRGQADINSRVRSPPLMQTNIRGAIQILGKLLRIDGYLQIHRMCVVHLRNLGGMVADVRGCKVLTAGAGGDGHRSPEGIGVLQGQEGVQRSEERGDQFPVGEAEQPPDRGHQEADAGHPAQHQRGHNRSGEGAGVAGWAWGGHAGLHDPPGPPTLPHL